MDVGKYLNKAKLKIINDNLHVWEPIHIPDKDGIMKQIDEKREKRKNDAKRKKEARRKKKA